MEREALRATPVGGSLAVVAGLQFLRLLRANQAPTLVDTYVDHYAVVAEDLPGDDTDTVRLRRRATGRVPDGRRIHADLVAARGAATELTTLPAHAGGAAARRDQRAGRRQRLPPVVGRTRQRARRR